MIAMNRVPIAFASDNNGAVLLGVAVYSLLASRNTDTLYIIYILSNDIQKENIDKLRAIIKAHDCELRVLEINKLIQSLDCSCEHLRWPPSMYARMYLPSLLREESKVLYLDIDVLVLQDLAQMYQRDSGEGALASVVFEKQNKDLEERKKLLHLEVDHQYFNSGVMLMELERMRQANTVQQIQHCMSDHKYKFLYPDQDILNIVLGSRVAELHPKYNWPAMFTRKQILSPKASCWGIQGSREALSAALEPAIIHFFGSPKPTQRNTSFYKTFYRNIQKETPWGNAPYSGKWLLLRSLKYSLLDPIIRLRMNHLRKKYRSCL